MHIPFELLYLKAGCVLGNVVSDWKCWFGESCKSCRATYYPMIGINLNGGLTHVYR